jgi:hypothetical protein
MAQLRCSSIEQSTHNVYAAAATIESARSQHHSVYCISVLFDLICMLVAAVAGGISPCNFLTRTHCRVATRYDSSKQQP